MSQPSLLAATPYFEVFDMVESARFYRDLLGFTVIYASPPVTTREGTFSHFMRVERGAASLFLNTAYDSDERPAARDEARWAGCRHVHLHLECDDVDALHAELTGRGLVAEAPATASYGPRSFFVSDPDGYRVVFNQAP